MADLTKIEWTDRTWNPTTGCSAASEGCRNCYAVKQTKRLEAMKQPKYEGLLNVHKTHFNGSVRWHMDALTLPFKWKKPCRVFVNSMSDLFHPGVPFKFVDKVMAVMALNPHITFQVLTKRPERMAEYFGQSQSLASSVEPLAHLFAMEFGPALPSRFERFKMDHAKVFANLLEEVTTPLPNLWLGTSVENQATADERIPHLLKIPAAVRFLSCEPLLGMVRLDKINTDKDGLGGYDCLYGAPYHIVFDPEDGIPENEIGNQTDERIDWVICGGESGPNARPMHPSWARSLRDQCQAAAVPFLFKQWGEWAGYDTVGHDAYHAAQHHLVLWPDGVRAELSLKHRKAFTNEGAAAMAKVGKARAGRLLDGREWNEFPEVSNG